MILKKIIKEFIKIISLSNPKYRIFTFLTILAFLFIVPLNILENSPNFSICYLLLKNYCYSYGLTRGVSSLLKGNFKMALNYNPLSYLVLIAIISTIILDFIKLKYQKTL
jgi:predicted ferric reductase